MLMPCAHPERLSTILPSYTTAMQPSIWEIRLHILLQGPDPDPKGILKVNECLNNLRDGWFMTPSDDTIQYPSLFQRLGEELLKHPDAVAFVVGQERKPGLSPLKAAPDQVQIGKIDGCQVCWNRAWIKDARYDWENYGRTCDGEFAVRLFALAPQRFVFIDEILTRHNSMEW